MDAQLLLDPKKVRKINIMRYKAVPPSNDLILKVVRKSGLRFLAKFEIVWGLPRHLLTMVTNDKRDLPPKYWHIFYDFEAVNQIYRNNHKKDYFLPKKVSILKSNKLITDGLRTR